MKIYLSHYSLNMLHNAPHQWACKMMGVETPNNIYFEGGNQGQRIIQEHVSGKNKIEALKGLTCTFPVVETKVFDDKTRFVKTIQYKGNEYVIQGFADGLDLANKNMMEIKLSSNPWSVGKYKKSMQRKLYKWGFPNYEKATLVTGVMLTKEQIAEAGDSWKDWTVEQWREKLISNWEKNPPLASECPLTDQDAEEADKFVMEGIDILIAGDFTKDLVDGKCTDRWCAYGSSCFFK